MLKSVVRQQNYWKQTIFHPEKEQHYDLTYSNAISDPRNLINKFSIADEQQRRRQQS